MFFSVDLIDLVLYCIQQLGVMLAVGAETIVLIAYAVSMRDGKADEVEARFSRAVHRALAVGFLCIILSGIVITALQVMLGQLSVVSEPVFLFKWLLIAALAGIYLSQRGKTFSRPFVEGAIGGTWYALFLVHILAPMTTWFNLLVLYAVFLLGFLAVWSVIVKVSGPHKIKKVAALPPKKVIQTPPPPVQKIAPPPPKIIQPPPPPPPPPKPTPPPPPPKPTPQPLPVATLPVPPVPKKEEHENDPHHSPWLPAIHIMPKNQAELDAKAHIMPLGAINRNS